jgi:hypothetical protein
MQQDWFEFVAKPFPVGVAGVEIDGVELSELDSTAAGCIYHAVRFRSLDPERRRILQACSRDLERVLPKLTGAVEAYFRELHALAGKALSTADVETCSTRNRR